MNEESIQQPSAEKDALERVMDLCERVIDVHAQVVMDTPQQRALHDRAVETFRAALAWERENATRVLPPGKGQS